MAEENKDPQSATPAAPPPPDPANQPVPPAQGTPVPVVSVDDIKGKTPDEIVKFVAEKSEQFGATKETMKQYEDWIKNTKPYIDVINEDPKLVEQVEAAYKKKYTPEPPKTDPKTQLPVDDTRKALENQLVRQFETAHGLDKLEGDAKKDMNVRIGAELMELLDPSGTKNYNEVIAGVSLEKLPRYFEKAYSLATMNDTITKAKETAQAEAQAGATGVFSSIPSTSKDGGQPELSATERVLADRMGVDPKRWLEMKKQINDRNEGR